MVLEKASGKQAQFYKETQREQGECDITMSNLRPPLDCSLNLAEIIDFHLAHESRSTMYAFADEDGHITEVSHFEVARAAHRVAHLLRPERRGADGEVVAIVALADVLVYHTVVAGCIIAGLRPFLIFHRQSAAAITHLLANIGSHRVLTTKSSLGSLVDQVAADLSAMDPPYDCTFDEIPLLGQLYPDLGHETAHDSFVPYPGPPLRTAMDEIALYAHSSGSTGFPKCIPLTHRTLTHFVARGTLAQAREVSPRHAVGAQPPAHTWGMVVQLIGPLLNGGTACIYPPASTATEYRTPPTPTSRNLIRNAKMANATGLDAVPALMTDWKSPEDIAYLKTLALLIHGGGPLPSSVGDFLFDQGINMVTVYGGTEFGAVADIKVERDAGEWNWIRFSDHVNIRWVSQGEGVFECQFLTVPETHQLAVENLPDVKGYSTRDLFERHSTKPDLYRIVGRLDDVITMANGEKTVPGPMENVILTCPFIDATIIFGRERSQIGVLIEPTEEYAIDPSDEHQLAKYRNSIWSTIEKANELAPAYARIYKEMVLVTQPEKPLCRAAKGTLLKKQSLVLYEQEIGELYDAVEASGNTNGNIELPSSWSSQDLEAWLQTHASLVADRDICLGRDLFDQGFDSLNATFLRHRIMSALRTSGDNQAAQNISLNFIYAHPTIEELASAIITLVNGGLAQNTQADVVEKMIEKYSAGFEVPLNCPEKNDGALSPGGVVLLTGSTGGLGSHILEILLALPSIDRVYACNRKGKISVLERQKEAFVDRALDVGLLSSDKLVCLECDTAKEKIWDYLSMFGPRYLRDAITVIIHNAWNLDFNKALSSFEPHVKGMRNLIDLARQSPHKNGVRFSFTSSVGSAFGWDRNLGPFPEELQLDSNVAVGSGYGEAKYVCERILASSGLDATSFRIGQITGSANNGAWTTSDWVPALVKSSITLGNFPSNSSGVVAWLPPTAISRAIVDVALKPEKPPFAVNLVHPRPISWDLVMSTMANTAQLPLIPFADWVQQLQDRSSGATAADVADLPGIMLLDFFKKTASGEGGIEFSTTKAQALSDSMKSLKPLNEDDMKQWMQYWRETNFIV
ncbi:Acetyl-CoA synthetase-like protein [Mycena sanguinolenta]|uniref:Acetyl-CoA synthetase-like protein n=1 Tax=Mycena sanguinolenta TaxID=230812 RepID=A0A8H6XH84_9AGAR|nr:Acetyl-CoA synthetase-like protein [Mycena sanguinolenta]